MKTIMDELIHDDLNRLSKKELEAYLWKKLKGRTKRQPDFVVYSNSSNNRSSLKLMDFYTGLLFVGYDIPEAKANDNLKVRNGNFYYNWSDTFQKGVPTIIETNLHMRPVHDLYIPRPEDILNLGPLLLKEYVERVKELL